MNSPKLLNYETRPLKFVERKMLLAILVKLCNHFNNEYQYIGFGGLSFTDFKLFHRELHINEMYSIEGGDFSIEKLSYNCPYSFIQICQGLSSQVLTQIDLSKKSIVWLDYDGCLDNYMFDDLSILFHKLPKGSIYLMTCNRELKNRDKNPNEFYTIDEFRDKFGDLAPYNLQQTDFSTKNNCKTIRKMLTNQIGSIIKGRNRNSENIAFQQLFNIKYQENRGAMMFSFGGVIVDSESDLSSLGLDGFPFISLGEDIYDIKVPNITLKEAELINKHLESDEAFTQLMELNIVKEDDFNMYKEVYKYFPYFFDVRI